jgi:2-keto-4-pentenoate hydratase/2-oxohepta-3-ene-1,7-dioic acid hydratase in catechol pathway
MRLLTFRRADGRLVLGVVTRRGILDVGVAGTDTEAPSDAAAFYARGTPAVASLRTLLDRVDALPADAFLDEATLTFAPCVPAPGKVLCVGLNYLRHAHESGQEAPTSPVLFSKFTNTLAGNGEAVTLPTVATEYDYEAELVVVIGSRARDVSVPRALDHVLGYCNGNDVSARDLQLRTSQWLLGKSLDGFLPIGPYVVTSDEVPDPQALQVRCWLNGELRQDSNTSDMIFGVAEIVSYASRHMTLEPGDIIATGTPEGVIFGMSEQIWLRPGDVTVVEIGPLGRLETRFVDSAARDATGDSSARPERHVVEHA